MGKNYEHLLQQSFCLGLEFLGKVNNLDSVSSVVRFSLVISENFNIFSKICIVVLCLIFFHYSFLIHLNRVIFGAGSCNVL
jgi:hypothetical protein